MKKLRDIVSRVGSFLLVAVYLVFFLLVAVYLVAVIVIDYGLAEAFFVALIVWLLIDIRNNGLNHRD